MHRVIFTVLVLAFVVNVNATAADSTSIPTPKSRSRAIMYSLLSTSVPVVVGSRMLHWEKSEQWGWVVFSSGLIVGPGVGHVYAENSRRFWTGAGTRGMVLSSSIAVATIIIHDSEGESWDQSLPKAMLAIGIIGLGTTLCTVSAIRDIAAADNSVDSYNSARGFRTLTLRPTYFAEHKAPGLMMTMSF